MPWRRVPRPDPAGVLVAVEPIVVVIRTLAAEAKFGGAFSE